MQPFSSRKYGRPSHPRLLAWAVLTVAVWTTAVAQSLSAQSETSQTPRQPAVALSVPLIVDDRDAGLIAIQPASTADETTVDADALVDALEGRAQEALLADILVAATKGAFVSVAALRDAGLEAEFRQRDLVLAVSVPPEQRKLRRIELMPGAPDPPSAVIAPAPFSAFLNLEAGANLRYRPGDDVTGSTPVDLRIDPVFNLHGWVLESSVTVVPGSSAWLQPNRVRLVKDFEDPATRLTVGDLLYRTQSFQGYGALQGVAYTKEFRIRPERSVQNRGSERFVLAELTTVEVLVNDRVVRTLTLPPGPYEVSDFPLARGLNRVILRFADSTGTWERELTYPFDHALLAPGVSDFSYALGVPAFTLADPALVGSHRFGVLPSLTLGANAQIAAESRLAGLEGVWATPVGTVGAEVGLAHHVDTGWAPAARLNYRMAWPAMPPAPTLYLSGLYRPEAFVPPFSSTQSRDYPWDMNLHYGQRLPFQASIHLGARLMAAAGSPPHHSYSLALQQVLPHGASLSLRGQVTLPPGEPPDWAATVVLSSTRIGRRETVSVRHDLVDGTARVTVQHQPATGAGSLALTASAAGAPTVAPGDRTLSGTGFYRGYRVEAGLTQTAAIPESPQEAVSAETIARVGTALAFAGGRLGLTRPIREGFVLVAPEGALTGRRMGVSGTSDGHAARSDWLGPAIVPDATPYTVQPITIEVPELPVGVDMEQDRFFPRPTYKSGTVVRPTATATVFVGGTLVDAGGEPVALAAGTVLQNDEPVAQFFTNRAGGFQIYGLTPGSYDAALAGDQSGFSFTVAAGTSGFVGLGTVRMGDRIDMTDIDTTETEP